VGARAGDGPDLSSRLGLAKDCCLCTDSPLSGETRFTGLVMEHRNPGPKQQASLWLI
jgi:hypothetical protein